MGAPAGCDVRYGVEWCGVRLFVCCGVLSDASTNSYPPCLPGCGERSTQKQIMSHHRPATFQVLCAGSSALDAGMPNTTPVFRSDESWGTFKAQCGCTGLYNKMRNMIQAALCKLALPIAAFLLFYSNNSEVFLRQQKRVCDCASGCRLYHHSRTQRGC